MKKNQQTNSQRRAVLKSAAISCVIGGSALSSEKWIKPVIDSVILPAHAATTSDTGSLSGEIGSRYAFIDSDFKPGHGTSSSQASLEPDAGAKAPDFFGKILNMIVPLTYAQPPSFGRLELFLQITARNVFQFVLSVRRQDGDRFVVYHADASVTPGSNSVRVEFCDSHSEQVPVTINSISPTTAILTIDIAGNAETFVLASAQSATPPQRFDCITPE